MTSISILDHNVRQLDGLYSLNDLHKAAGGEKKHEPHQFLRNDQTRGLIAELSNTANSRYLEAKPKTGTYVCKELVYAYAMWISPKFSLAVIRAFDSIVTTGKAEFKHNPGDVLTKEQADVLRGMITDTAQKLPKEEQGAFCIQAWSKLKTHYGVPYRQIPQTEFTTAASMLARHVANHITDTGNMVEGPTNADYVETLFHLKNVAKETMGQLRLEYNKANEFLWSEFAKAFCGIAEKADQAKKQRRIAR